MLVFPYLKFTPFSFEEIQCKRKTFSLAVFFCRWYISSETILRYWFSWKVSIKVLSCTSLVPNLSNKSNKIFPYDLISLFQTVRCIIFSFNTNNFRTKQENIIINTDWKFDLKNEMDCLPIQHQMENSTKLLPVSCCPALMWRLLIANQMVPNFTVPICWSKAINITYFIVHLYPIPYIAFYNWLQVGLYLQGCDVDWRRQARSVFHVRPPPLRHLRASIFPTFEQERRTFVTPAVWNSLFPRSI